MSSYWQSHDVPQSEKLVVAAIGVIVSYTAWANDGLGVAGYVTVTLSLLALGLLFACDAVDRREGLFRSIPRWRIMLRDPLCGFAFPFLAYLLVQWINAQRGAQPARIPWLPSAIDSLGAWELSAGFLPVVAILLLVRHGLHTRRSLWAVLSLASLTGAIVAVFGIVQHCLDADAMFWLIPVEGKFFSSFTSTGHAATYFILVLCVSLSFCAGDWQLLHVTERPLGARFFIALTSAALAITAIFLTGNRIALIFAWLVLLLAAGQATLGCWQAMDPGYRLNAVMLLGAVIAIAYFTTIDMTPYRVGLWRMKTLTKSLDAEVTLETHSRMCREAFRIWTDHPVFGTGGGGYGALRSVDRAGDLQPLQSARTAHVHCEPLEFLLELGIVGMALLIGMVAMAGRPIVAGRLRRDPFFLFGVLGLVWTLLNSLLATPFRNPGVFCLWALAWIGFSRLVAIEER